MKTTLKKTISKGGITANDEKVTPKKMSKTWQAVLLLQGTGEILDMKAVLK